MRPTTALPLVTTREPTFFACSQLVALLMLASGAIVATSAPFCLRMLSMDIDIASSNRMALLPISSRPRNLGHAMEGRWDGQDHAAAAVSGHSTRGRLAGFP